MKKALLAVVLLALPSMASAAPRTCRDLLIRVPLRTYQCSLATDSATSSATMEFADNGDPTGHTFVMTFTTTEGSTAYGCSCDAKGSLKSPSFYSAKGFTCVFGIFGIGSTIHGKVGGKDGAEISSLQLFEHFNAQGVQAIGACSLP